MILTVADVISLPERSHPMTTMEVADYVGCSKLCAAEIIRAVNRPEDRHRCEFIVERAALDAWQAQMASIRPIRMSARSGTYFIVDGEQAVKIGESSNVAQRLKNLQDGNPRPLKLVVLFPGRRETEGYFHGRFRRYRVHKEWYWLDGELRSFLRKARSTIRQNIDAYPWLEQ